MKTRTTIQRTAIVASTALALGLLGGCQGEGGTGPVNSDNTARNVRDRDGAMATPPDQGSSEGDIRITQSIRQALVKNDGLSTNAHNVKIITQSGVVTLRGPVENDQEKATVLAAARGAPGVRSVADELEVTAQR